MIQVIARHPTEAERVQVAKGDRRERHDRGRDLVHFGDVRVLQIELDPVQADEEQEGERAQADQEPEAALDAAALVRENVSDSVQGRSVRENFNGWRSTRVHVFRFYFEIHGAAVQHAWFECQSVKEFEISREVTNLRCPVTASGQTGANVGLGAVRSPSLRVTGGKTSRGLFAVYKNQSDSCDRNMNLI